MKENGRRVCGGGAAKTHAAIKTSDKGEQNLVGDGPGPGKNIEVWRKLKVW